MYDVKLEYVNLLKSLSAGIIHLFTSSNSALSVYRIWLCETMYCATDSFCPLTFSRCPFNNCSPYAARSSRSVQTPQCSTHEPVAGCQGKIYMRLQRALYPC